MKAQHNERIIEKRLRNRYTLVRKRIIKRTLYINKHKTKMDPRRLERWEKAVRLDLAELNILEKWMSLAQKYGYFIFKVKEKYRDGGQ